jgi:hypothetical protein
MNDKLYSLRIKAVTTIEIVNPDTGITHHREFFDEELFAELIVQECINYCGENLSKTVGGALKIHFGVEE